VQCGSVGKNMRIGIISTMVGAPWGGSEELWAATAMAARSDGHQVAVAMGRYPWDSPALSKLVAAGVRLFRPTLLRYGRIGAACYRFCPQYLAVLAWKPDIVLVSQGMAYDPFLMRRFRLLGKHLKRTPYVLLCQYNDDRVLPDSIRAAAKVYFANARTVAFVAKDNMAAAQRQLVDQISNGIVVQNPLNLNSLEAVAWPETIAPSPIACVARLEAGTKGHDILLAVLAQSRWRERAFRLSLYGTGSGEKYIRDLIAFYGLGDKVNMAGHVADIRSVWAKEQLLVLASRGEGTPLALLEAMTCGRPAVVTSVGGNSDWVADGVNGFLAAAPTVESLSAAMESAWESRAVWRNMGEAARQMTLDRLDPDPGRALLNILTQAVGRIG